jgi:hypothetical protein
MKKIILSVALLAICIMSMGAFLETRNNGWVPLRTAVAADDSVLDGTTAGLTYTFADKPSYAVRIQPGWNCVDIYGYGTDAADKTVNFKIYTYKENGPRKLRCTGTATTGTAVTGAASTFYFDIITVTNYVGNAVVCNSGNNGICILKLGDVEGDAFIAAEIDIVTANVVKASFEMSGY